MAFVKDKKYIMRVMRIDSFNGRKSYVVEYEGNEYRVRMYPHQSERAEEIGCYYIGDNEHGRPLFQQDYQDVLYEVYEEDCVYPFKIINDCTDINTGAQYYVLSDQYGFNHRVYNQQSPLLKVGDEVEARVTAVGSKFLSLDIQPKPTTAASYSLGDLINFSSVIKEQKEDDFSIDLSALNPEKDTTLRDYQIENKRKIYQAWQNHRSVMLQMPTGTGKTRLFVSIARDLFDYGVSRKKAVKILFLAHRKELIEQISDHLGGKYRLAHGLIVSQNIEQKKFPMQIGSVPTLTRRLEQWEDKDFDIIIIDEAHHVKAKSYKKIIDFYPNAKILGVTATPYRLNGAGFRPEFDELIISPSVAEFIKRGYLSEYQYYSIKPTSALQHEIDQMKLDFEGDYKESEMMGVMDRDYIRAGILSSYQKFANGKKGIVYTISKEHNIHLAAEFKKAGIESAAIDSDTPKEQRDELVRKFRNGKIQVLFNVNIFSEGFDCPDVEVIQLARPTKSLAMYLQQVGRGLRPHGDKERLLILDNVGLFNKFGFPSARRKWRYHFEGKPVDETPQAHLSDNEEEREVHYIFEGDENVEMLHDSATEVVEQSALDTIEHDYMQSFLDYTKRILNEHTAQSYARSIRPHLDAFIREHIDSSFHSLFNLIDKQTVQTLADLLKSDEGFMAYNNEKHHVFSAALNRYLDFVNWYAEHASDEIPLPPVVEEDDPVPAPQEQPEPHSSEPEQTDEEIDNEIASIERAIAFLNKKHFPVPKEMTEELNRLRKLKQSRSRDELVKKEITSTILAKYDLSELRFFSYKVNSGNLKVVSDFDYQSELADEMDMMAVLRIMRKSNAALPPEIKQKLGLLDRARQVRRVSEMLYKDFENYVQEKEQDGIHIRGVVYSEDSGVAVDFSEWPTESQISHTSGGRFRSASKALIITFPDGTVIEDAKSIDAFIKALEKIGIDRIKTLGLTLRNRPFIDDRPHETYASRRLSTGEYVCTNLSNGDKVKLLDIIAEGLGIQLTAELGQ